MPCNCTHLIVNTIETIKRSGKTHESNFLCALKRASKTDNKIINEAYHPEEFNALSLHEKGEYTFQQGKYFKALDTYSKKNKLLYVVYDLIIEVTLNKETNKIEDIQAWHFKDIYGQKKKSK